MSRRTSEEIARELDYWQEQYRNSEDDSSEEQVATEEIHRLEDEFREAD